MSNHNNLPHTTLNFAHSHSSNSGSYVRSLCRFAQRSAFSQHNLQSGMDASIHLAHALPRWPCSHSICQVPASSTYHRNGRRPCQPGTRPWESLSAPSTRRVALLRRYSRMGFPIKAKSSSASLGVVRARHHRTASIAHQRTSVVVANMAPTARTAQSGLPLKNTCAAPHTAMTADDRSTTEIIVLDSNGPRGEGADGEASAARPGLQPVVELQDSGGAAASVPRRMGRRAYPDAKRPLVTAGAGGAPLPAAQQ